MPKFTGANGRKPSTEARRFVYQIIATTLESDLLNDSKWLYQEMDQFDQRRVRAAVKKVIVEMRRKATG